jgi:hypothetical protein
MAAKFIPGDKVSFLNDVGGGVVSRVDNSGNVIVVTDDGFEIPVQAKELIHSGNFAMNQDDTPAAARPPVPEIPIASSGKKPSSPSPVAEIPRNIFGDQSVNMILGFIPENPGPVFNNTIACYLINDSPFFAYYVLGTREGGTFYHLSSGVVEAETKNYISAFDQTSLSKLSGIHLQAIFFSSGKYSRKEPVDEIADLSHVNFSKESYYRENEYFEENAVLFRLFGEEERKENLNISVPEHIIEQKTQADAGNNALPRKKEPATDTMEIDLHANELTLENSQLTPSSIMTLQMSRFRSALEEAVSKKMRRLVVIHGVGQGTLKMEIRKELQEKYPFYIFQDASFREYGFGATMVHLIADKKQ